jgi:hypothetical protein
MLITMTDAVLALGSNSSDDQVWSSAAGRQYVSANRETSPATEGTACRISGRAWTHWQARWDISKFPRRQARHQVDVLGLIGQLLGRISAKPKLDFSIVTEREAYRPAFEGTSNFNWTTL